MLSLYPTDGAGIRYRRCRILLYNHLSVGDWRVELNNPYPSIYKHDYVSLEKPDEFIARSLALKLARPLRTLSFLSIRSPSTNEPRA